MARKRKQWSFRLNDTTQLDVSAAPDATRTQIRRRGRWGLVVGIMVVLAVVATVASATVSTDQQDYSPGSTVTVRGGNDSSGAPGYVQGHTVNIAAKNNDTGWTGSCTTTIAAADGSWSCAFVLSSDSSVAVGTYSYTATSTDASGNPISENGTFTDAAAANVNFAVSGLSAAAASHSFTINWSKTNNGGNAATGSTTFTGAGPSTDEGTQPGTTFTYSGFPTSFTEGSDTCTLAAGTNPSPASGFTTGAAGSHTTVTASYSCVTASTNHAPTANAGGPYSGAEGSNISLSGSGSDSDAGDSIASYKWTSSVVSADTGASCSFSSDTAQNPTISCTDDGSYQVSLTVKDSHGAESAASTANLTVSNANPTATKSFDSSVNEGSSFSLALTGGSDPGSNDTLTYQFDCGDGSGYAAASATASTTCSTTDNGSRSVKAKILDDDGGYTEYTDTVTVNNVAPTATFGNTGPVNEGSSFTLSLTDPYDPSSADTTAGFTYAFDCGDSNGYGSFSSTSTASCSTTDNGTRSVKGKIKDKDGGVTEYTGSVTVNNVAPTATFNAPTSVNEGSNISLSLTSPYDPSSADTTAGFSYAFDCGDSNGYGSYSSTSTASCSTTDNGSRTVKGKIKDKDGGVSEYTANVTINNVAPQFVSGSPSFASSSLSCTAAGSATLNYQFTDPGSDTWTAYVDWNYDGVPADFNPDPAAGTAVTKTGSLTHSYTTAGLHVAAVKIVDDDNGSTGIQTASLWVNYNLSSILQPVNDTRNGQPTSVFKYGSVVPVKVEITDCAGLHPSNLDVRVFYAQVSSNPPSVGADETATAIQADAGNQMRFSDPIYIYNWSTKAISDPSSTVRLTVKIYSNGSPTQQSTYSDIGLKLK